MAKTTQEADAHHDARRDQQEREERERERREREQKEHEERVRIGREAGGQGEREREQEQDDREGYGREAAGQAGATFNPALNPNAPRPAEGVSERPAFGHDAAGHPRRDIRGEDDRDRTVDLPDHRVGLRGGGNAEREREHEQRERRQERDRHARDGQLRYFGHRDGAVLQQFHDGKWQPIPHIADE